MHKSVVSPLLIFVSMFFAFCVLGISLYSASIASHIGNDLTSSSRVMRFSAQIVPGHILYPFTVVKDKVALLFMDSADQCKERLELARQRLDQASHLIELGDTQVALETIIKGQKYVAEAAAQCQHSKLSSYYKTQVIETINIYTVKLLEMKQYYSDTDRAVIDQTLSQLDAISMQLEGK